MKNNALKSLSRIILPAVLAAVAFCEPGDRDAPGDINDLAFFRDAAALSVSDGKVFIGNQTLPPNTRSLALTATGDNDDEGEASQYDLRYFYGQELENKDFDDDWDDAHRLGNESPPSPAGEVDVLLLPRMNPSRKFFFALKVKDEIGQESDISNIVGPVTVPLLSIPVLSNNGNDFGMPAALAGLGDINLDEFLDFAVGDPLSGKVLVYHGLKHDKYLFKEGVAGAKVHRARTKWLPGMTLGGNPAESFGAAVAGVGFVNGDRVPDILVGAPDARTQAGLVYLFYMEKDMASPVLSDDANSMFAGDNAGDGFGSVVAACQDLNRDGYGDFAVSSPGAGQVFVFLGGSGESSRGRLPSRALASNAAALIVQEEAPGDEFGAAMDCGLDVNGDGYPDLVISAPANQNKGAVYIIYGGNAGQLNFQYALNDPGSQIIVSLASRGADITIRGTVDGARFGQAVRLAGNLYGRREGRITSDLAVSAAGLDPGQVLVFYGGDEGNLIFPPEITSPLETQDIKRDIVLTGIAGHGFGESLAGGWDLNDDHSDDLIVGAPDSGYAMIYFWDMAKSPDNIPRHALVHPYPASRFGEVMLALPDFNLDDLAEILIAAPQEGKVYFEF